MPEHRRSVVRQAHQPAQLRQAVNRRVVEGVAVGRRVQRQREEGLHAAPALDDDVAQVDNLRGGVAEAVDAEQGAVIGADDASMFVKQEIRRW